MEGTGSSAAGVQQPASAAASVPSSPPDEPDTAAEAPGRFDNWGEVKKRFAGYVPGLVAPSAAAPPEEAEEPEAVRRKFDTFQEAHELETAVTTRLKNDYARTGRVTEIGKSEDWFADHQSVLEDAGLRGPEEEAEPKEAGHKKHNSTGTAYAIGYGLMEGGSEVSNLISKTASGQYVTPEMQDAASSSVFSGLGMGVGGLVGEAFGPAGGLIGQFAGGAVGQVAGAAIQAGDEREQATREAAERLAVSLGAASDKLDGFRSQIEATGAPVAQLGQVLEGLSSAGPLGENSIAGAGAMTNALGEYAQKNYASVERDLGDPTLFTLSQNFARNGRLNQEGYHAVGLKDAVEGNSTGLVEAQRAARATTEADDPEYQARAKELHEDQQSWGQTFNHAGTVLAQHLGIHMEDEDPITNAQKAMDARRNELEKSPDPEAARENDLLRAFGEDRQTLTISQAQAGAAAGGVEAVRLRGGSAADIRQAGDAYEGTLSSAEGAETSIIARLQTELANPANKADEGYLKEQIATHQQEEQKYTNAGLDQERTNFDASFGEEQAQYGVSETRSLLHGASAEDLLRRRRKQAQFLAGEAADPENPLSPTERAGIEEQSAKLRFTAQQAVYTQKEGSIESGLGQSQAQLATARTVGDDSGIQAGEAAVKQNLLDLERQLQSELTSGNLLYEQRYQKQQQLAGVQAQIAQNAATDRRQEAGRTETEDSSNLTLDTLGLSRKIRVGGSAALDTTAEDADYTKSQADLTRDISAETDPVRRKALQVRLRENEVTRDERRDQENQFVADPETRMADIRGEGTLRRANSAFERSREVPFYDGAINTNPLTAGNELLGELTKDEARRTADFGKETTRRSDLQASGRWDTLAEEKYTTDQQNYLDRIDADKNQSTRLEHEKMEAMFGAVPESIIGGAGMSSGMGAAVTPTAAASAYYDPSPLVGRFGPGAGSSGMAAPGAPALSYDEMLKQNGFGKSGDSLEAAHGHDTFYHPPLLPSMGAHAHIAGQASPADGAAMALHVPQGPSAAHAAGSPDVVKAIQELPQALSMALRQILAGSTGVGILSPQSSVHAHEGQQATTDRW